MIRAISKYWWVFTLRGLLAIAFGLAALLWPALTLGVMVLLFGLFVLFEGFLTLVPSFGKGDEKGGWTLLFEGVAGLLVCVIVLLGASLGSILWPRVTAGTHLYTGRFSSDGADRLQGGVWYLRRVQVLFERLLSKIKSRQLCRLFFGDPK